MTNQKTKNAFIIDHDENYVPVLKTTTGQIQLSASFSIAEQCVRSGERLKRLIDFICRNNNSSTRRNKNGDSVGITHRLAAQVVYLAYWENCPLEFWIEGGTTTVVLVRFSRQPELTFVLDVFIDGLDPHSEIQGWWNFFCETISSHADIWQIPLVMDESIYRKLNAGNHPLVPVDLVHKH
jgi:hypothetical protein